MRKVYLDNSATTPVDPQVAEAMMAVLTGVYGNPSSVHEDGRQARMAMEKARWSLAGLIGATPEEIVFTSGGTEANNLALQGAAKARVKKGRHLITTAIEHHAVLDVMECMEKNGYDLTVLPVNEEGIVAVEDVRGAIRPDTTLISVMHANNEVGSIQPIEAIGELARERGILFHVDAVQSLGKLPISVINMNIDMLSVSGHKIYGPKGVGALYLRKGVRVVPMMFGGGQERKVRPGTENMLGIVGFGEACRLAGEGLQEFAALAVLRDRLLDGILARIPDVKVNGPRRGSRLPNNVNVSIRFVEGESLLLSLDMQGIAASSGSACTSGSLDPSHVLLAMGLTHEIAHGSLRFTLGKQTTQEDVDYVLEKLPPIVERLRAMSPLFSETV
ncbi:MAG: cysteine desulfurase NifS [Peptococcaceae bacterium]|nr:cysteine desulfurase NifS [Peptococcaceae bacterium]